MRGSPATAVIAAALALTLTSCRAANLGPFPEWIIYAEQERDLSGEVPENLQDAVLDAVVTPSGERFFALRAVPDSADPLVYLLLDRNLSVLFRREASATVLPFSAAFTTLSGEIQVGNVVYDPAIDAVSLAANDPGGFDPIVHDGTLYYRARIPTPTNVELQQLDASFAPPTTPVDGSVAFTDGSDIWDVQAQFAYPTSGSLDTVVAFLAGNEGIRRVEIPVADLDTAITVDPTTTPSFPVERLQDTPAGVLAFDGTAARRFDPDTGNEIDRFEVDDQVFPTGRPIAVFDPAGEFYLLFDLDRAVLYRVGVWW